MQARLTGFQYHFWVQDADLILLALLTHEPHFSLLREAGSLEDVVKEMGMDPADWSAVSAAMTWSSQTSVCPAHHASFHLQFDECPLAFPICMQSAGCLLCLCIP